MADLDPASLRELQDAILELTQTMRGSASILGETKSAGDGITDFVKAQKEGVATEKLYNKAKEDTIKAAKEWSKSVLHAAQDTSTSASKYKDVIGSVTQGLGNLVGHFGLAGKALEGFIKGFGIAAQAVMEQNDAILKSYDELGKFGSTLNLTTKEVLQLGLDAGYSSKNLESLYKNARSLGGELVSLGGSSSQGVKAFAEIAAVSRETRENFRALGISQEELTEYQANYVKMLAQTGGTLAKSPKELREESTKYLYNLTKLAELTGKSVKEQQEAQKVAQAQKNLNAFLFELEQDRIAAADRGDKVEAERLAKQIENTKVLSGHIVATESAEKATAMLASMATKNTIVYDEQNAMLIQNNYDMDRVNKLLREGKSVQEAINVINSENIRVYKEGKEKFGDNLFALGKASEGIQAFTMQTNEARTVTARAMKQDENDIINKERLRKLESEGSAEAIAKDKKDTDDILKTRNSQAEAENNLRQALDQLVQLISGPVNTALQFFGKVLDTVGNAMKGLADIIKNVGEFLSGMVNKIFGSSSPSAPPTTGPAPAAPSGTPSGPTSSVPGAGQTRSMTSTGAGRGGTMAAPAATPAATPATPAATPAAPKAAATASPTLPAVSPKVSAGGGSDTEPTTGVTKAGAPTAGTEKEKGSTTTKDNPIYALVDAGPGFNIVKRPDGNVEKQEGNRNWRNNNPGNIEFGDYAKRLGAIGTDGRFAVFSSYTAGRDAKGALIFDGKNYAGLDLRSAIFRYAPPNENNSEAYFDSVLNAVGGQNKKMAEYSASERNSILDAMEKMEGYKVGKTTKVSAKFGGIADGPITGYPATLHGREAIIPFDQSSILAQLMKPVNELKTSMISNTTSNQDMGLSLELLDLIAEKLDTMIDKLSTSNETQEKLLKFSMV